MKQVATARDQNNVANFKSKSTLGALALALMCNFAFPTAADAQTTRRPAQVECAEAGRAGVRAQDTVRAELIINGKCVSAQGSQADVMAAFNGLLAEKLPDAADQRVARRQIRSSLEGARTAGPAVNAFSASLGEDELARWRRIRVIIKITVIRCPREGPCTVNN